jgi:two-component system cell cycle sensor histidine kinase/response regulator CckA
MALPIQSEVAILQPSVQSRKALCYRLAQIASFFGFSTGWVVLLGRWARLPSLIDFSTGPESMTPVTAATFILSASALWLLLLAKSGVPRPFVITARILSAATLAIGVATLAKSCLSLGSRLGEVSYPAFHGTAITAPGRMAASTSAAFILLGISLLLQTRRSPRRLLLAESGALIGASIGFVAVLGYLYQVRALYSAQADSSMALSTALILIVVGLGSLVIHPDDGMLAVIISGQLGGAAARRLLPVFTLLPVIIGWLRLKAQYAGWFGTEFGVAITVGSSVILFSIVVWFNAFWLNRIDLARARAVEHEEGLAAIVASSEEAIFSKDLKGIITSWNHGAEILYGYSAAEMIGQPVSTVIPVELQEEAQRYLAEIAAGKRVTREETARKRKDGTLVPVSLIISPVRNAAGTIIQASTIAHDISARKRIEEALREQAQMLETGKVFVRDLDSRIVFWPRGAEKVYGFTATEALGAVSHQLFQTEFPEPLEEIERKFADADVWEGELTHVRRDGERIAVASTWIMHRDGRGTPLKVLETNSDITARIQAEKALEAQTHILAEQAEELSASRNAIEENQLMLRSVLDSMSEGLVATDQNGDFVIWNPSAEKLVGLGPNNIPMHEWTNHYGLFLADTVTPYPPDQNPLALAIRGETNDAVMFIRNPQLKEGVFLEIHASPLKDKAGTIRGGVSAFRDVTARRQIEEQVRQMEERFSKAFRSSPIAITISAKQDGTFIDANDAFLKMMGYDLDEVLGRTAEQLKMWSKPEQREQIVEMLDRTGSVTLYEAEFINKFDEKLTVETSAEVITLDGIPCILASTRDVTEARSLEQQFRQAQKVEAIGMLAGGIAHDFNNMLAVIIGYAGLAETKLAEGSPEQNYVGHVLKAANRAAGLTRQLLTFSRRQEIQPTVLDLNEVITNFSAMLTRVIGEQIELTIVPGVELGAIRADRGQVEQLLMNLLVNARDAMPGGGTIVVETSNANLDEAFLMQRRGSVQPGPYVLLSVSDTGCGMTPETLSKIFDPFFTTKPVGQGTGLGLPAVYGVVKQAGGHIWVYSEPDTGTAVKLYFPRIDLPAEPASGMSEEVLSEKGTETILLVEDDDSLRELASILLTGQGFKVLEAKDGNHALALAKEHPGHIDLMLTDVIMPGMSGGELASRFSELHPGAGVLYMSGYTADLTTHHHSRAQSNVIHRRA